MSSELFKYVYSNLEEYEKWEKKVNPGVDIYVQSNIMGYTLYYNTKRLYTFHDYGEIEQHSFARPESIEKQLNKFRIYLRDKKIKELLNGL